MEYKRVDHGRIYFGGYVSKADSDEKIGKWISGSIPEKSAQQIDMKVLTQEIVN